MQKQVIIVPSRMSPFWSLLVPPSAFSPKLTQLEKIILLCQSVSSGFCWVLSSALHALCSLWSASSLYSVTTVNLDHPQGPNTRLFLIVITWHCFLLEQAAKLLQLPLYLILAPSADPMFHISGGDSTTYPVTQAFRKGVILYPSPILSQSPVLSCYPPNPFQTYYCLIIPSNTDLGGSYNLLESSCHHFLLVSLHFSPSKWSLTHTAFLINFKSNFYHSLLLWVTCFLMYRVKM